MIALVCVLLAAPQSAPFAFSVDATKTSPISPYVYGVNFPEWERVGRGFTLARQGGNRMSAYNWETNASNAGSDYRHQNDGYMGATDEPGWTGRVFMEAAQKNGAAVILTIPTTGYVSADKNADGDVNQTPNYLAVRFHKSYAKKPGGKYVYPPDTTDKAVYQDEYVAWIQKIKAPNTPVWFSLDNEPDLWGHTHERIWPKNPTYAQIIANNIEYGTAIKTVAPKTMIFGPANYGWMGFRTFQGAPDANGRDFLDVYLASMRAAEKKAGKRLLDVLDIHFYPEARGDGVRITTNDDKPGIHDARIQASRSLWDPTYVEDSWITENLGKKPIALLPGVQKQIASQYPGTKLAITEYNYGGGRAASGLIAQADVLGLYGRYGLFAACNWGLGPQDVAQIAGFRAFTDLDGKGARFGDLGLRVSGETASDNALFAARDAKNPKRLTLVAINKTGFAKTATITLKGFKGKTARGFVFAAPNFLRPEPARVTVSNTVVTAVLPPETVASIEVRG
ncbi:MAG: hypothetical protein KIS66_14595 [Fimbriimonadaceae bacterium]|nr:hypothetical protein [Fimbriimonadaceae bacterium]